MNKINLEEKLAAIETYWDPKVIEELNGQHVRLVKFKGEFAWHSHESEDELFLVLNGSFDMQFRDRFVNLKEGELIVIPRGVEHCPRAEEEVHVLLFEPASTQNTGNVDNERTIRHPEKL